MSLSMEPGIPTIKRCLWASAVVSSILPSSLSFSTWPDHSSLNTLAPEGQLSLSNTNLSNCHHLQWQSTCQSLSWRGWTLPLFSLQLALGRACTCWCPTLFLPTANTLKLHPTVCIWCCHWLGHCIRHKQSKLGHQAQCLFSRYFKSLVLLYLLWQQLSLQHSFPENLLHWSLLPPPCWVHPLRLEQRCLQNSWHQKSAI